MEDCMKMSKVFKMLLKLSHFETIKMILMYFDIFLILKKKSLNP